MCPMVRYEPGGRAPASSTYALVGHYGEATNVALWIDEGDRFPLITVAGEYEPFWYIEVDVAHQGTRAA